jgi:hypothetical protein
VSEFYTDIIASTGQEDEASALTCKLVHGSSFSCIWSEPSPLKPEITGPMSSVVSHRISFMGNVLSSQINAGIQTCSIPSSPDHYLNPNATSVFISTFRGQDDKSPGRGCTVDQEFKAHSGSWQTRRLRLLRRGSDTRNNSLVN